MNQCDVSVIGRELRGSVNQYDLSAVIVIGRELRGSVNQYDVSVIGTELRGSVNQYDVSVVVVIVTVMIRIKKETFRFLRLQLRRLCRCLRYRFLIHTGSNAPYDYDCTHDYGFSRLYVIRDFKQPLRRRVNSTVVLTGKEVARNLFSTAENLVSGMRNGSFQEILLPA